MRNERPLLLLLLSLLMLDHPTILLLPYTHISASHVMIRTLHYSPLLIRVHIPHTTYWRAVTSPFAPRSATPLKPSARPHLSHSLAPPHHNNNHLSSISPPYTQHTHSDHSHSVRTVNPSTHPFIHSSILSSHIPLTHSLAHSRIPSATHRSIRVVLCVFLCCDSSRLASSPLLSLVRSSALREWLVLAYRPVRHCLQSCSPSVCRVSSSRLSSLVSACCLLSVMTLHQHDCTMH